MRVLNKPTAESERGEDVYHANYLAVLRIFRAAE